MDTDADCLFCKIVAGEVPAEVVHETDTTVAFRDLNPQAPTHVLVIPKTHRPDAAALAAAEPGVYVDLVTSAAAVA
ncbi:MAG: HIT domain-containing protein, partial [Nocardioidaceae bacterium]